jgi:DNA-binding response OmpR family regulator
MAVMALPSRQGTILLVEDDAAIRGLYQTALRVAGFDVIAVDDGFTALRWIEQERPTAVVLDLGLPRVSGRDVQRELHAHAETHDIPIVVVTGEDTDDMDDSDVACVLRKPASPDALVAAVRRCLRDRAP